MKVFKNKRCYLLTIALLISIYISSSVFLPIVDLPQFAGQAYLLKNYILSNTNYSWYSDLTINYFIPYWTINFITIPLSFLLPMNYAVNMTIGIIFFAYVYGFSKVREKFGAPVILDWMLLPVFFGMPYIWGFSTFLMGVAMSSFLLIAYLNYLEEQNKKNLLICIFVGTILYFSHILCFLFMGLTLGLISIVQQKTWSFKDFVKNSLPLCFLLGLLPLFFLNSGFFDNDPISMLIMQTESEIIMHSLMYRLENLFLYTWGYYFENALLEKYAILLTSLFLIFPWLLGFRPSKKIWKYMPLFSFCLVWLILPQHMGKTSSIYPRYIIYFFPFYILIFEKNILNNKLIFLILNIGLIVICISTLIFPVSDIYLFNKKEKSFIGLLNSLNAQKKSVHFEFSDITSLKNNGTLRLSRTYAHFSLWYQSLRNGWVDFNFAWYPTQIFRYKSAEVAPEIKPSKGLPIEQFLNMKNCDVYDYLFIKLDNYNEVSSFNSLLSQSNCSHIFKVSDGHWYIYEKNEN